MTLDQFQAMHERNFGPGYGGHVTYFAACRVMVPILIDIARLADEQINVHQDTDAGLALRGKIRAALKALEGV